MIIPMLNSQLKIKQDQAKKLTDSLMQNLIDVNEYSTQMAHLYKMVGIYTEQLSEAESIQLDSVTANIKKQAELAIASKMAQS